jgi:3(or 17)beta-hydroxysteroid dehydrogenase
MTGRLKGKAALITGGASGIGAATAKLFVEEGASVAIADIQDKAGKALARQLGEKALFRHLDVSSENEWRLAVDSSAKKFGRFDILVNCAGISGGSVDIEQMTLALWNQVMGINMTGTMLGCQAAIRAMKKAGNGGSIINISSTVGIKAWAPRIAYGTSKAAVAHITKAVALHCGKAGYNIRCNAIHPGSTDTPILDDQLQFVNNDRAALLEMIKPFQVLNRVAAPREISTAILFLASEDSSFVTGESLVVDGGFVLL